MPVPIIHAVTTPELLGLPDFLARAAGVMRAVGGRGAVHLRGASLPARRLYELARALRPAAEATGCWLVVNDRVDVALAGGADGVQLTSSSIEVADARRVAAAMPLGASVHAVREALAAEAAGATWVVAGHVYRTASHHGEAGRGEAFVRAVVAATRLPVIVIGGVLPSHVPRLRAAGAAGVAAIRGIWGASDADRAASDYLALYDADAAAGRDDHAHGER